MKTIYTAKTKKNKNNNLEQELLLLTIIIKEMLSRKKELQEKIKNLSKTKLRK